MTSLSPTNEEMFYMLVDDGKHGWAYVSGLEHEPPKAQLPSNAFTLEEIHEGGG